MTSRVVAEPEGLIVPYCMPSGSPLIPNEIAVQLMENWRAQERAAREERDEPSHMPLIRLFQPAGRYQCLISQLNPKHPGFAYGLVDFGVGSPEMGYIDLDEIMSARDGLGLTIERDRTE